MLDDSSLLPHLAWKLYPHEVACEFLARVRSPNMPAASPTAEAGDVGILCAYSVNTEPEVVGWLRPIDGNARLRLRREANTINRFNHWLRRAWPVSIWQIATAWTFYEQWLTRGDQTHWQANLAKCFRSDPLLDQLLAQSDGWILWRFQLEALMLVATGDPDRANHLARKWMTQSHRVNQFKGLQLPNGLQLKLALSQRAYRLANDSVIVLDRPNYTVIARIQAIFTDSTFAST